MPHVPDVAGADILEAALAYAQAGWYVLPVRTGKHPGSFVGRDWPSKSTRDEDRVTALFTERGMTRPGVGIALHVGRSGALAFDVDIDAHLPTVLATCLARLTTPPSAVPYQMTRGRHVVRGHFLFSLPEGVMFGNGLGSLRTEPPWGDVRGRNGIIVAAPSPHASGGRYAWHTSGELPELPRELGRALLAPQRAKPPPEYVSRAPHLFTRKRLDGLLHHLANAQEGERNSVLFWTSCRVGEMVGEGLINGEPAEHLLVDRGMGLGLPQRETVATVRSGLTTGQWAAS